MFSVMKQTLACVKKLNQTSNFFGKLILHATGQHHYTALVLYNSSAVTLSCCWQISVDAGVAFHQHQWLVEQWDSTAAVKDEASDDIHPLD